MERNFWGILTIISYNGSEKTMLLKIMALDTPTRSDWDLAIHNQRDLFKYYTQWDETDMADLINRVRPILNKQTSRHDVLVLIVQNNPAGRIPYQLKNGYHLFFQPNAVTCTHACAMMCLADKYGLEIFKDKFKPSLKPNYALFHFKRLLSILNAPKEISAVKKQFNSLSELRLLLETYKTGAIGLEFNDNSRHYVCVDKIDDRPSERLSLSVRDPALGCFGELIVEINNQEMRLIPNSNADSIPVRLLGDFITFQNDDSITRCHRTYNRNCML